MKARFSKDGRLIIPTAKKKTIEPAKKGDKGHIILEHAYCPEGCDLVDPDHMINGYPGIRLKFVREGMEGEFVISSVQGDFDKVLLSGKLKKGVKDDLFCPHCDAELKKLVNCNCSSNSELVVIGLTPKLDFNEAITFCNVTGCANGAFIKSGDAILHARLVGGN